MSPTRDRNHRRWIGSLPCSVPGCRRRNVECAHFGIHSQDEKASDLSTFPLCRWHHTQAMDSLHKLGPRQFMHVHNLDIPALIQWLTSKPVIRIEAGKYVALIDGERFLLRPVTDGFKPSLQCAVARCKEMRAGISQSKSMEAA
jgi:hypothetical protein